MASLKEGMKQWLAARGLDHRRTSIVLPAKEELESKRQPLAMPPMPSSLRPATILASSSAG